MPEPKGRKKGRNRERRRDAGDVRARAAAGPEPTVAADHPHLGPPVSEGGVQAVQAGLVEPRMPSPFARATGALLAIITGIIAAYMVNDGLFNDSGANGIARVVAGVLLALLAVVVGVLSVAPEFVRGLVVRRGR